MAKVFASIGGAFSYAAKNTFKNPAVWFLVTVVAILDIVALVIGLLYLVLGILSNILGAVFSESITNILSTTPVLSGIKDTLLQIFPIGNSGALIAIGIVGLVVFLLFSFFLGGLQVKIYAGKDITFSGFFGTVGRGFQLWLLTLIYDIIVLIVMVGVAFGVFAGTNLVTPVSDLYGFSIALGIWSIIIVILAVFFAIFKYPALVNFSRQSKFGAGFHFKEIGAMIGATKWYKILLGVIVNTILASLMIVVAGLICWVIAKIPGVAGVILCLIVAGLASVFIFYLWSSYYAKLIENKA